MKLLTLVELFQKDSLLRDLLRYNEFTKDVELTKKTPWGSDRFLTDEDTPLMKYYFSKIYNTEPSDKNLYDAVMVMAKQQSYHPIKNYLESLVWDGKSRADFWLHRICGATDNIYVRNVSLKILVGAIARIYQPGEKFDYMLILEGPQGIRKSTLVEILGGHWYLDTHLSTGERKADMVDVMRTSWIIEISDLAGFKFHDVQFLKSFLSRRVDRVRLAYGRRAEDFKRQSIFIGTHNPSGNNQYFNDDTDNRRFWPVECGKLLDIECLINNRDQLFAEALVRFKAGEKLYLDNSDALDILKGMNEDRQVDTPLNELIINYIKPLKDVTNIDIIERCFNLNAKNMTGRELMSKQRTIGILMKKIGWKRGTNENRGRYYRPEGQDVENPEQQVEWEQ